MQGGGSSGQGAPATRVPSTPEPGQADVHALTREWEKKKEKEEEKEREACHAREAARAMAVAGSTSGSGSSVVGQALQEAAVLAVAVAAGGCGGCSVRRGSVVALQQQRVGVVAATIAAMQQQPLK